MEDIMKFLEENNAYLDCANDDINTTTANDRMVARLLTTVSQNEIEKLKFRLESERYRVDELEDEVSRLEQTLNYFKELWNKFIKLLQDKLFSSNKYDDLINELYKNDILDKNDMIIIENEHVETYERDDVFER